MKILIIEDEKDLAKSAVMQLSALGHQVTAVHSLDEANRYLEDDATNPDLVIADHALPDGKGIEYLLHLRELFPDRDYVIASGLLSEVEMQLLNEEQLTYFRKPFLYKKVLDELKRKKIAGKAVTRPPFPVKPKLIETEPPGQDEEDESTQKKKKGFFGGLFGRGE